MATPRQVQRIASVYQPSGTSVQITVPNVTAGNLLSIGLILYANFWQDLVVSDNKGNTWEVGTLGVTDLAPRIYYAKNVAGGTTVITATWTFNRPVRIGAEEIRGASTTAPLDVAGSFADAGGITDHYCAPVGSIDTAANTYLFAVGSASPTSRQLSTSVWPWETSERVTTDPTALFFNRRSALARTDERGRFDSDSGAIGYGSIVSFKGTPADPIILDEAVSVWPLDEVSGRRSDVHGVSPLVQQNTVTSALGKVGNAAVFDGGVNSLYVENNVSLEVGDIPITIALWVKFSALTGATILYKRQASAFSFAIDYLSATSRFKFRVFGAAASGSPGEVIADTFGAATTGVWYFVLASHDPVTNLISLSINNTTANTATHTAGLFAGNARIGFGEDVGGSYLSGQLDQVCYWKRLLTATEKAWLYNSGAGRSYLEMRTYAIAQEMWSYTPRTLTTQSDNFNDNSRNTAIWNVAWPDGTASGSVVVSETNNRLEATNPTSGVHYSGYQSVASFNFTGKQASVKFVVVPGGNVAEQDLIIALDANNSFRWRYSGSQLLAIRKVGGSATTIGQFTAGATERWLRIRELSGTVYFDTSSDGLIWTNKYTDSSTWFAITSVKVALSYGSWMATSAYTVAFDDFGLTSYSIDGSVRSQQIANAVWKYSAWTRVHYDTFTDTQFTGIASHTPNQGTGYTILSGGFGAASARIDTTGTLLASVGAFVIETTTAHSVDHAFEYTVVAGAVQDIEAYVRGTFSSTITGYRIMPEAVTGLTLRPILAGIAQGSLATGGIGRDIVGGDVIRGEVVGTVVTGKINGIPVFTYDTAAGSPLTTGEVLLAVTRTIDGAVDNFSVYQRNTASRSLTASILIVRPDGTEVIGSYTPVGAATLHQALNDVSDTTYIQSIDGTNGTRTVEFLQGAVVRATRNLAPGASFAEESFTLTAGEKASVTDWSDIRIRITDGGTAAVLGFPLLLVPTGDVVIKLKTKEQI